MGSDKEPASASEPLSGLRVIDLGILYAGPLVAMHLADFGAEVIKIEHPNGDPFRNTGVKKNGIPLFWKYANRNKLGITLDLKQEEGKAVFKKMVGLSDIVVESFSPETLSRLGLGYDALSKINPRIVLVSVSGFGQDGPYSHKPGFGTLAECMSGFANLNGYPDSSPLLPPLGLADFLAGLAGSFSALIAYMNSLRTGRGQLVDVAMYEPLLMACGYQVLLFQQTGIISSRTGNRSPEVAPRNLYRTKDNKWIGGAASTQSMVDRLFESIGLKDILGQERFINNQSRLAHVDELDAIIQEKVSNLTASDIMEKVGVDAPMTQVYNASDLFSDEHLKHRQSIVETNDTELKKIAMPNVISRLSQTPGKVRWGGPRLGEHNRLVYIEKLGLSEIDFENLVKKGII